MTAIDYFSNIHARFESCIIYGLIIDVNDRIPKIILSIYGDLKRFILRCKWHIYLYTYFDEINRKDLGRCVK